MVNLPFLSVVPIHAVLPDEEYNNRTLANFTGFLCRVTPPVIISPPIVACRSLGSGQRGAAMHRDAVKIRVSARQRIRLPYHHQRSPKREETAHSETNPPTRKEGYSEKKLNLGHSARRELADRFGSMSAIAILRQLSGTSTTDAASAPLPWSAELMQEFEDGPFSVRATDECRAVEVACRIEDQS